MQEDFINSLTSSLEEKLGSDNYALISDDIADLITRNNIVLENTQKNNDEINKLKEEKDRLISANGKLLQSIPVGFEKKEEKKEEKEFRFRDAFDEKGRFKR